MSEAVSVPKPLLIELYRHFARIEEILATLEELLDKEGLQRIKKGIEEYKKGEYTSIRKRPSSITTLVFLEVLLSGVCLFLGWFEFVLLGEVGKITFPPWGRVFELLFALVPLALFLIGSFYLLNSLLSLAIAYGLLNKRTWTWNLARILAVMGILAGLFSLPYGLMGIILCAIILFYVSRKEVRAFLGKSILGDKGFLV